MALYVYLGEMPNELVVADDWFDNQLPDEYYVTDFSKRVIKTIDKSDVINENMVESPVLGCIPMTSISRGSKGLILYRYTDKIVNLVSLRDNCIPLLLDILKEKGTLTVSTERLVDFYEFGYIGEINILNDNSVVSNAKELFEKYLEFRTNCGYVG